MKTRTHDFLKKKNSEAKIFRLIDVIICTVSALTYLKIQEIWNWINHDNILL